MVVRYEKKKMAKSTKSQTLCGALSPTGVGAKIDPRGGGPISKGKNRGKKKPSKTK